MVKKSFKLLVLAVLLLSIPSVLADIEVSSRSVEPYAFKELSLPAKYQVTVTNDNPFSDTFYIDTLLDMDISPRTLGFIAAGATKTFDITVSPSQDVKDLQSGKNLVFEYFVRGDSAPLVRSEMVLTLVSLQDSLNAAFPSEISPDQAEVTVGLSLREDVRLTADVRVNSELLTNSFPITLTNQRKDVVLALNPDVSEKNAGIYTTNFFLDVGNETAVVEREMILGSVVTVSTQEEELGGILSSERRVTKTNDGNSATKVTITMSTPVVSSLFTTFNDAPKTRKEGQMYIYEWEKELNPGESYTVSLKTNYYMPFLVFLLLLLALVIFKVVTKSPVEITKKVARVKTKSGAFASKIIISVKNTGKPVTNVKIIDRLPAFTEILPNKFSVLTPSEIKKRSVVWSIPQMATDEEILFSYIVYSKVNIFGKLEVPPAVVTFIDHKDNFLESQSERIFIISEEEKKDDLEEAMPL